MLAQADFVIEDEVNGVKKVSVATSNGPHEVTRPKVFEDVVGVSRQRLFIGIATAA